MEVDIEQFSIYISSITDCSNYNWYTDKAITSQTPAAENERKKQQPVNQQVRELVHM